MAWIMEKDVLHTEWHHNIEASTVTANKQTVSHRLKRHGYNV